MTKLSSIFSILVLTILGFTVPVSYAGDLIRGLDVTDIAILFQVDRDGVRHYPDVSLKFLLPKEVFEGQVLPFSREHDGTPFGDRYEQWRVVALRYDPCAPNDSTAHTRCHPQVRLVTQPGMDDTAMHLLFREGSEMPVEGDPIIADLRAIQAAAHGEGIETIGVPLNVHPALIKESSQGHGPTGTLIQMFIRKYCSPENLEEITFTNTVGGSQWNFFHGSYSNGHWIPGPIHNIPHQGLIQSADINGNISPVLVHSSIGLGSGANGAWKENESRWKDLLLRVENPEKSNIKRVDCASCHISSKLIAHGWKPDFSSAQSFVNPPGVTGFAEYSLQPNQFNDNLRNFGYREREPTVSTITANSAAYAADLVNRSQHWTNPSHQDCSAWEVRDCFSSPGKTAGSCLSLCKPRD